MSVVITMPDLAGLVLEVLVVPTGKATEGIPLGYREGCARSRRPTGAGMCFRRPAATGV